MWASISRADWRPADVAILPALGIEGSDVLAVADYYGNVVRLYIHIESSNYTGYAACGVVGCKVRGPIQLFEACKGSLDRPSSLAVASSGVDCNGCPWAILLIAECGAMCISVFRVFQRVRAETSEDAHPVELWSEHLSDLAAEQIGSGLHVSDRGMWGWLGIASAPNGDVLVTDCDNDLLLVL